MSEAPADGWQVRLIKPRFLAQGSGPAEVGDALCETLLARENLLEDAEYQKIVTNQFVVELPPEQYARQYAPLEPQLSQQWIDRLLNYLATANSRQGRREYRFGGRVRIEIRPAPDLAPGQFRIRSRWQAEVAEAPSAPVLLPAGLELLPAGKLWQLRTGLVTIGREPDCDIALDMPRVQELRLVSGRHAYLNCAPTAYRLFDGTPAGQPSMNGTYINGQPVPRAGQLLQDGDVVILAALRPGAPRPDTPGVVGLRFKALPE